MRQRAIRRRTISTWAPWRPTTIMSSFIPDDRLYAILGPTIAYGYNPWAYVDYTQYQLEEYWGNQFAIHGGTWDYEPDMTSPDMAVPRLRNGVS
jgi:hypothetical protein